MCDLHRIVGRLARGQRTFLQAVAQRDTIEKFGDEVRDFAVCPNIVDGEDVRVVLGTDCMRFLFKSLRVATQ